MRKSQVNDAVKEFIPMSHISSNHKRDRTLLPHDSGSTAPAKMRTLLTRKTYIQGSLRIGAVILTKIPNLQD